MSQDIGATFVYECHAVSLLWQSKQAVTASAPRVFGGSQAGSALTGGFAWWRPLRDDLDQQ